MLAYFLLAHAAEWVVLTAGSNGYGNYRHQSDVAHAYQIAIKHGIPADHIITLMYDDVANDPSNPYPGKLFNKPTAKGTPGVDNYKGLVVDYKKDDVTPKNFINVLTGEGDGKVLKSTEEDDVFVYWTDHGGAGIIAFPSDLLHVAELTAALEKMASKKMFKKMVFYLEACESGSMFDDTKLKSLNIYATTASNATESSWGTYCPGETPGSSVDGKDLGSCLGDLYSIKWMEDTDANPKMTETLLTQFQNVKKGTDKSHVLQFGPTDTYDKLPIGDFEGPKPAEAELGAPEHLAAGSVVNSRDIDLHLAYRRYVQSGSPEAALALEKEVATRRAAKAAFEKLVAFAYPTAQQRQAALEGKTAKPTHPACELGIHRAMKQCRGFDAASGYALQFQRVAVNVCADESLGWGATPSKAEVAAQTVCSNNLVV